MIFQEPKFNCITSPWMERDSDLCYRSMFEHLFRAWFVFTFRNIYRTFLLLWLVSRTRRSFIDFPFLLNMKKEASSTKKNFFNNFKEPSQVHRKSIVQSGERAKAETSDPDPQKRFRSSIVFARKKLFTYLLSCNHLSQLIVTWNSLPHSPPSTSNEPI